MENTLPNIFADEVETKVNDTQPAINETSVKTDKKEKVEKTKTLKEPRRILPELIVELIKLKIPVSLSEKGYLVHGFYGLNKYGYAELLETEKENQYVVYDSKKKEYLINNFEDLVRFNSHVWKLFYNEKKDEYIDADEHWFSYLTKFKCVRSVPL